MKDPKRWHHSCSAQIERIDNNIVTAWYINGDDHHDLDGKKVILKGDGKQKEGDIIRIVFHPKIDRLGIKIRVPFIEGVLP